MSMSCFDCHDYMDGYNQGKKEGTIEGLEQIKKNINKELIKSAGMTSYRNGLLFVLDLIDNKIKKSKE